MKKLFLPVLLQLAMLAGFTQAKIQYLLTGHKTLVQAMDFSPRL